MNRRSFLTGLTSALAAPAIVRFDSIMPVRAPKLIIPTGSLYSELVAVTRLAFVPRLFVELYYSDPLLRFVAELPAPAERAKAS